MRSQHLIGTSAPIRQVYDQVAQVARTNTTVLMRGESGTGKEMIAHAIHYNSRARRKPFIKVSCAALPESLIESELFGYERGAFTGAQGQKKGRFELADGGTLFLDEIGDLSLADAGQAAARAPGARIRAARRHREHPRQRPADHGHASPLEKLIAEATFREDLFYRLNVFTIFAPPLRERKPDIMLLADHFLEKYSSEHGKSIKRISTPAIDMLTSYHWPGNVRELENTIERAVLVCDGAVIHAHHLPPTLQTAEASGTVSRRARRSRAGLREGSDLRRAQVDAWQLRPGGEAPRPRPSASSTTKSGSTASTRHASGRRSSRNSPSPHLCRDVRSVPTSLCCLARVRASRAGEFANVFQPVSPHWCTGHRWYAACSSHVRSTVVLLRVGRSDWTNCGGRDARWRARSPFTSSPEDIDDASRIGPAGPGTCDGKCPGRDDVCGCHARSGGRPASGREDVQLTPPRLPLK